LPPAFGGVPYVIPRVATMAGVLGYVACGQELAAQIRHGAPRRAARSVADGGDGGALRRRMDADALVES
jgi:hypothetical protein